MPRTKPPASHARRPATAERTENDPLYVTALARGLSILKCCGEAAADLTVSEIAKLLGLPQSTVWRSCYTLVQHGFLVRVENDRLRPGLAVLALGYAALSRHSLAELARPGMEAIAKRFPGAVSLGAPQGMDMLYLARIEVGPPIYPGLRVGSRVGVLSSAMGWAWLAALPARRRNDFLAKARTQARDQYERIADQLAEAIRSYQQNGFLVNSGVIHPELNAIAIPIGAEPDQPVASISFGGVLSEFPARRLLDEVAPQLMEVASGLCASIRAGSPGT